MVATINEVAFHDNPLDAAMMCSPCVRDIAARSSYKAVLKFLHPRSIETCPAGGRSGNADHPVGRCGRGDLRDPGQLGAPPPAAAGGAPPTSIASITPQTDYGFDGGKVTTKLSMRFTDLSTSTPHYFRVAALNAAARAGRRECSEPAKCLA